MKALLTTYVSAAVIAAGALAANGQDLFTLAQWNMQQDAQFNQQLGHMWQQNQMGQQQLMNQVVQQYGPQLRAEWQQYMAYTGASISFEQYVYYWIMTAGGTNVQAGLDAQRQQFEGLQNAHRTVQQGYDSYNAGWWANQARIDGSRQRYSEGANRGNWYYQDPYSGHVYTQPYSSSAGLYQTPYGQLYIDQMGQHYLNQGSGWTQMNMLHR
ncbi:MAG TPA: hypothetical protein PKD54_00265 [Pirellulaceae bacterium]|nr:hypothetical protein [Pirellulaceae bacterium]